MTTPVVVGCEISGDTPPGTYECPPEWFYVEDEDVAAVSAAFDRGDKIISRRPDHRRTP